MIGEGCTTTWIEERHEVGDVFASGGEEDTRAIRAAQIAAAFDLWRVRLDEQIDGCFYSGMYEADNAIIRRAAPFVTTT